MIALSRLPLLGAGRRGGLSRDGNFGGSTKAGRVDACAVGIGVADTRASAWKALGMSGTILSGARAAIGGHGAALIRAGEECLRAR